MAKMGIKIDSNRNAQKVTFRDKMKSNCSGHLSFLFLATVVTSYALRAYQV